jgi:hypothetical protein
MDQRQDDRQDDMQDHRQAREFDTVLETLAGLAAANIVLVETLHERGVLDKSHFAHAFARALDTLAPEHRGGLGEFTPERVNALKTTLLRSLVYAITGRRMP